MILGADIRIRWDWFAAEFSMHLFLSHREILLQ
jgi:hypothetical protein